MAETETESTETRLQLRSRLGDLALVVPWLDSVLAPYDIPGNTRFGIELCLEEAISNIIRHGYGGGADHGISLDFAGNDKAGLTFTVEDSARHFAPEEQAEVGPSPQSIEEIRPGGLGIQLMRKFATTLRYEQLGQGNRLTLGFQVAPEKPADATPQ
jgi:anti-sigma regulatory factor (Ser/Thr protein kinase)